MISKKITILTLSMLLGSTATIAIVVPVVLQQQVQNNLDTSILEQKENQIFSIRISPVLEKFISELPSNLNLLDVNNKIKEAQVKWPTWIDPVNENGDVIISAIKKINSLSLLILPIASQPITIKTDIEFNSNFFISSNIIANDIIINPVTIKPTWNDETNTRINNILKVGGPYISVQSIKNFLDLPPNIGYIKSLIKVPPLSIKNIQITIKQPVLEIESFEMSCMITYNEGYVGQENLEPITDLKALFIDNSITQWNDFPQAQFEIQKIIDKKQSYPDIAGMKIVIDNNAKNIIKLLNNPEVVSLETWIQEVSASPNTRASFTLQVDAKVKDGSSIKLQPIVGLITNIKNSPKWILSAGSEIQKIIMPENLNYYPNLNAIKVHLNLPANRNIIQNLLSHPERISEISAILLEEQKVSINEEKKYQISAIVVYKEGFISPNDTSTSISNLISDLTATIETPVAWKNEAEQNIRIIFKRTVTSLEVARLRFDYELIISNLDNGFAINELTIEITEPTPNSYQLKVSNLQYKKGFIGVGGKPAKLECFDNIIGLSGSLK